MDDLWQLLSVALGSLPCTDSCTSQPAMTPPAPPPSKKGAEPTDPQALLHGQSAPEVEYTTTSLNFRKGDHNDVITFSVNK